MDGGSQARAFDVTRSEIGWLFFLVCIDFLIVLMAMLLRP
jgi:hypothetical protein